jgi:hypothetical protein
MRRAKKEGRWMATAPVGYTNKATEGGDKYIAPKEPEASIIMGFSGIADGHFAADQIRKEATEEVLNAAGLISGLQSEILFIVAKYLFRSLKTKNLFWCRDNMSLLFLNPCFMKFRMY